MSPMRAILATSTGRTLALLALGMGTVVLPVAVWANLDGIRAALPRLAAIAGMNEPEAHPYLVTFGPRAPTTDGDHDHRQVVRLAVPADAGRFHVRVFDADTGGAFDELKGRLDTTMRYRLHGGGSEALVFRDAAGVVQETVTGEALGEIEIGADPAMDGRWATLFSAEPASGADLGDGMRGFLLVVEGASGNDGNVFDVAVSTSAVDNRPPAGLRLQAVIPTLQLPRGREMAELRFEVPADAPGVSVENFDAAGARIHHAGRFRSAALAASGQDDWRRGTVELSPAERGQTASVTASGGAETPNDIAFFIGVAENGRDPVERPIAVDLPIRAVSPNRRPEPALSVVPLACAAMGFDASASHDPDGGPLTHRWRIGAEGKWLAGAAVTADNLAYGVHPGRLEVFDASGLVGDGAARDFSFFVKPPPIASFEAPALVGEGEGFALDGGASTSLSLPSGNAITRYHWSMGDGSEIVQEAGDPDFGRPLHRYATHGTYTVTLTVTDASDNPCNSAATTRAIAVNAPPVANAGGGRKVAPGETVIFDAGPETGVDGDRHAFAWTFGDGAAASGARAAHAYDAPGTYAATLTVDDGRGARNSVASDRAIVIVNAPPVIDGIAVPDRMVAGAPGVFDAGSLFDPDGEIGAVAWDLGDGTTSTRRTLRHAYAKPGTYEVSFAATDDSGLANATTLVRRTLVVSDPGNLPPVADAGGDREAVAGQVVTFDGSASCDPDGAILSYRWDFGDGRTADGMVVDHVYRTAGTYRATLEVTDASGRANATATTGFDVVVANRDNLSPVVRVGGDRAAFVNEILDFDATGTTDPDGSIVSVDWDFGDGARASGFFARHAYKAPGQYRVNVLVRDDSGRRGASAEAGFTVTVTHPYNRAPVADIPTEIAMETGVERLFDAGGAFDPDGRITRWRWDFGDGSGSDEPAIEHAYARPGTYFGSLTLTDDSGLENGVTVKKFVAFVEERRNAAPVAMAGADRTAIVGERVDFDGGASSDPDGSLIRFDWDFGNGRSATGERRSIAYFAPGRYTVTLTVTDNSGQDNATASDTLTVTVLDAENASPVAVVEPDRPAAIGEPVAFSGAGSSDADGNILAYRWDFGDGATGEGREVIHAYDRSGTYVARLTVIDSSGLANDGASAERRIRVNEPPVAVAGPDQHVTASVVTFDGSGSFDPDGAIVSYDWDFGDGGTGTGERVGHAYANPGEYRVRLTVADDSGAIRNTAEDTMTVRVNALPVVDAGFDMVAAPGETLTFDGRRSTDPDGTVTRWTWDFRDGAAAEGDVATHAFARPGVYAVELTVADDSGHANATDFSQIVVTVNAQPVADAGPDVSVAPGEGFTLSGERSFDPDGRLTAWRWDIQGEDEALEGARVEHRIDRPGVYKATLTVTDDSSASNRTAQAETTIRVNHQPLAEAGHDVFSETLRIVLDGSGSADADNDGLAYSWDFGDGHVAEGMVVEHTYATGGVYPVVLTVDDGRGLANSRARDALTVRINRAPQAIAGDNRQACVGDVVVFDGSSSVDPDGGLLRYAWDFGDGESAGIVNPTKVFQAPGSYRVRLDVTDESGLANASHAAETLVSVLPAPVANAGRDMRVCANQTVRFDGRASTDIDGVVNRFSWDFGDGQSGGGDQPEHVYAEAGTYRVTLEIEGDNLGLCSPISRDDILVTVASAPRAVIAAPTAAAVGEEVTFNGTGSFIDRGVISAHEWDFGDGTTATEATVRHVFTEPGVYRVQLRASASEEAGGCASASAIQVVTVNAAPIADAGGDRVVEVDQPLPLSAAASHDPDGGIAAYEWDFGDGEQATGVEVSHIWRRPGRYEVALTVDDGTRLSNARTVDRVIVEVTERPAVEIRVAAAACAGERLDFSLANLPAETEMAALAWSFGDGTSASGAAASHAYAQPGRYTVGVAGPVDRAGSVLMTPVSRVVTVNQPPVAIIEADAKTCPGIPVIFDGSRSFDPDGGGVAHEWDFGDGTTASGSRVEHSFAAPGRYPVRLTVTDGSGSACAATTRRFDLFVNAPPVADAGPDIDVFVGGAHDAFILDAGRSRDADGDALQHYWTLSNGMEFDGEKARVALAESGTFVAELTTADPHGLACSVATDTLSITGRTRPPGGVLSD